MGISNKFAWLKKALEEDYVKAIIQISFELKRSGGL